IFVLIKAAQGFAVRRTSVRRSRKPAENADQDKNGHLWMGTNYGKKNQLEGTRSRILWIPWPLCSKS
ncbi:MAG: hypothetical protein WAL93_11660, partial [Desulfobacterales bacterium]